MPRHFWCLSEDQLSEEEEYADEIQTGADTGQDGILQLSQVPAKGLDDKSQ